MCNWHSDDVHLWHALPVIDAHTPVIDCNAPGIDAGTQGKSWNGVAEFMETGLEGNSLNGVTPQTMTILIV